MRQYQWESDTIYKTSIRCFALAGLTSGRGANSKRERYGITETNKTSVHPFTGGIDVGGVTKEKRSRAEIRRDYYDE